MILTGTLYCFSLPDPKYRLGIRRQNGLDLTGNLKEYPVNVCTHK